MMDETSESEAMLEGVMSLSESESKSVNVSSPSFHVECHYKNHSRGGEK